MTADTTATAPRDILGSTFQAVLFDMDGTLVDSSASVATCWTQWAHEHGVPLEALATSHFHGVPARDIIGQLLPGDRVPAAYARIVQLEVADAGACVLLPGAAEALTAAAGRAAVVTSCSGPLARARLDVTGLAPQLVVTADDVSHGKPHPEPFLTAAAALGAEPSRCLVVEDAPAGLAAGLAAGAARLAVATTYRADQLTADLVVADLSRVVFSQVPDGVRVLMA